MSLLELSAGPLSLLLQPSDGTLRHISAGGHLVLLGISAPVRDRNWGTVPGTLRDLDVQRRPDGFTATFEVVCQSPGIDFTWRGSVEGLASGSLTATFDGVARSTFLRNRIGFCLLHPASASGSRCRLTHADGSTTDTTFPTDVRPHQPFLSIRSISHEFAPGRWADVHLEGETWETEDQRNWLDASFKTYCTPLGLPFPVEVPAGARIHQSVSLTIRPVAGLATAAPRFAGPVRVKVDPSLRLHRPAVGLGWDSSDPAPLSQPDLDRARLLRPGHLRIDVNPGQPGSLAAAAAGVYAARRLQCPLEVALHVDDRFAPRALDWAAAHLHADSGIRVARWLLFDRRAKALTDRRWPLSLRARLAAFGHARAALVGGSDCYFTELNRFPPPADVLDGVCFSTNPQVHAFDDLSLVECLSMIPVLSAAAQRLSQGKGVHVTPITLRPRFNPNATAAAAADPGRLPDSVDARQATLFGAAWTAGALASLARSTATSATLFALRGWHGTFEADSGSPLPHLFPSAPATLHPLAFPLARWLSDPHAIPVHVSTSDPLRADGFALAGPGTLQITLANVSDSSLELELDLPAPVASVKVLDATTLASARSDPHGFLAPDPSGHAALPRSLVPHAIALIDLTTRS